MEQQDWPKDFVVIDEDRKIVAMAIGENVVLHKGYKIFFKNSDENFEFIEDASNTLYLKE